MLVSGKSASFQFKDRNVAPAEIGRRLDARYLLEGSVRRAGDRVRVNAELTEAATGRQVWSDVYEAEGKDIFGVQDDIARRVVGAAAGKMTRFERDRVLAEPTENLAAYEYVLRGRGYFSRATRDSNDEAQDMFQKAIDLDPKRAADAELGVLVEQWLPDGQNLWLTISPALKRWRRRPFRWTPHWPQPIACSRRYIWRGGISILPWRKTSALLRSTRAMRKIPRRGLGLLWS